VRVDSSCLPVGRHTLLLVSLRLLALLLDGLLLLLGLVRVELLALAEALALRSGESLVRILRLNLSLGREVALVSALVSAVPTALSAVACDRISRAIERALKCSPWLRWPYCDSVEMSAGTAHRWYGALTIASTRAVALVAHAALVVAAAATEPASRAARGRFVSGSVHADGATVESGVQPSACGATVSRGGSGPTNSTLFMAWMAFSASASWENRTKPKPRLRPVSRSLTTTYTIVKRHGADGTTATYGLFHIAKLLKLGSERYIIRVPREAASISSVALTK
jgi:hypothetical protein